MDLLADLEFRGQLYQQTDAEGLKKHLATPRKVYAVFDPTRNSLTIGNLVQILLLRRFQAAGHTPVVVMGRGTGMIGDPSGKEAERQILTPEQVALNVAGQRVSFERLLISAGPRGRARQQRRLAGQARLHRSPTRHRQTLLVNMMIQRRACASGSTTATRASAYTEFSYMLLQAYDFSHLLQHHGVTVQAAVSDQWGKHRGGRRLDSAHAATGGVRAHYSAGHQGGRREIRQNRERRHLARAGAHVAVRVLSILGQRPPTPMSPIPAHVHVILT